jgi:hypothetical protein
VSALAAAGVHSILSEHKDILSRCRLKDCVRILSCAFDGKVPLPLRDTIKKRPCPEGSKDAIVRSHLARDAVGSHQILKLFLQFAQGVVKFFKSSLALKGWN